MNKVIIFIFLINTLVISIKISTSQDIKHNCYIFHKASYLEKWWFFNAECHGSANGDRNLLCSAKCRNNYPNSRANIFGICGKVLWGTRTCQCCASRF